ncbi:hypothetical protein G9A89_023581 [Geosiphon pyriformis]|nr:hypothetical protein G9A89_023581 [Geosiphon pyriformis]
MENKEIKRTTRPEAHDCNECQQCQRFIEYTGNFCKACQFMFFKKHYKDFSSGNEEVDKIIKNPIYIQYDQSDNYGELNYYEWIPWEHLSNINEIARGGFGIIYKATLIDGLIYSASIKHYGSMEYKTYNKGMQVAIKIIKKNSSEVFKELNIQRAIFINNSEELYNISKILGITQNAETLEYGIVMKFARHGDMRKYLSTNFHYTSWSNKFEIAIRIASGLDSIHSSGMVHRDLHSGNILQFDKHLVNIGDLGLCQTTNHEATTTTITTEEKKIFGVIPYIPPEVLRGEKFTTAGDIYSLGMLLWELSTGKPPFHDCPHDEILIMAILNDLVAFSAGVSSSGETGVGSCSVVKKNQFLPIFIYDNADKKARKLSITATMVDTSAGLLYFGTLGDGKHILHQSWRNEVGSVSKASEVEELENLIIKETHYADLDDLEGDKDMNDVTS